MNNSRTAGIIFLIVLCVSIWWVYNAASPYTVEEPFVDRLISDPGRAIGLFIFLIIIIFAVIHSILNIRKPGTSDMSETEDEEDL